MQNLKPIDIPIKRGTHPSWQPRLNYPNLFNMFVGEDGLFSTPGSTKLSQNAPDIGARAIWFSIYGKTSYIVVTSTKVIQEFEDGSYKILATIVNSGMNVQICENIQKQVTITDGKHAYVFDQQANNFVTLGPTNEFDLEGPISCVSLDGITVILDSITNGWRISAPNNALSYPVLDNVPKIADQSLKAVGLEVINSNLYIFGTGGVERWVPNGGNSPYLFPFAKDTSFYINFGGISTDGIVSAGDEIYYITSKYTYMRITEKGYEELIQPIEGVSKIISQYVDVNKCIASYTTFRGNFFIYFSFPETGISWVYNIKTKTFSLSDDILTGAAEDTEAFCTPNGVFKWSLIVDHKHRSWTSDIIRLYKGTTPYRQLMSAFELLTLQGAIQSERNQLELTLSFDGMSWTNTIARYLGKTGHRTARTVWNFNVAATEVMYRIDYYGDLDLTIYGAKAFIK